MTTDINEQNFPGLEHDLKNLNTQVMHAETLTSNSTVKPDLVTLSNDITVLIIDVKTRNLDALNSEGQKFENDAQTLASACQ